MNSRTSPPSGQSSRSTPDRSDGASGDAEHVPGIAETAWLAHVSDDTDLFDRLVVRHRERQRRYHRIEHVEAVLTHVEELASQEPVDDVGVVVAAALYHDAIYESQHPANERASARLARRDLAALGWSDDRVGIVGRMIEGTKTHTDPPDHATAVLFDADLAILGAEPEVYAKYVSAVRDEYGHLDDREWSAGRSAVLAGFLGRAQIYATESGRERWESAARRNITDEAASMTP